jgi:hypothetical protein
LVEQRDGITTETKPGREQRDGACEDVDEVFASLELMQACGVAVSAIELLHREGSGCSRLSAAQPPRFQCAHGENDREEKKYPIHHNPSPDAVERLRQHS